VNTRHGKGKYSIAILQYYCAVEAGRAEWGNGKNDKATSDFEREKLRFLSPKQQVACLIFCSLDPFFFEASKFQKNLRI
jgi:hypothetical protein